MLKGREADKTGWEAVEAWDKDGEEQRAEDAGREEDDMTGDGKVECIGLTEIRRSLIGEEEL